MYCIFDKDIDGVCGSALAVICSAREKMCMSECVRARVWFAAHIISLQQQNLQGSCACTCNFVQVQKVKIKAAASLSGSWNKCRKRPFAESRTSQELSPFFFIFNNKSAKKSQNFCASVVTTTSFSISLNGFTCLRSSGWQLQPHSRGSRSHRCLLP